MERQEVFKTYPKVDEFFETSDEQKFFNESDAKNHARKLKDKHISKLERGVEMAKQSSKPSAEERIEAIGKLETVEAVNEALKGETAKTVKQAGEDRIAELES